MKRTGTLPTKRSPINQGIFKRLRAVTRKRQQVAAAGEIEGDDGGARIGRALMIIFLFHVVAIALIMIHQKYLDSRPATVDSGKAEKAIIEQAETENRDIQLPKLSSTDQAHAVRVGDNYTRIAEKFNVNEDDLRLINGHANIKPGLILKIPPKRIVAADPPEVAALRPVTAKKSSQNSLLEDGLVEVNVQDAPKAQVVELAVVRTPAEESAPIASGKSHVIKAGDNIWGLAKKYRVSQEALMKANGIKDARKVRVGMKLVIPK
ncbi:MAG: LysM peptidoglycan-binding domain-containing protein [Verrucomicrobia bacterium]|nr:MAG: LysM peptidoglycan-binding domain-containing protein [Verrucomicrobiota bacterium]